MTAVHQAVNKLVSVFDAALSQWQVLDGWNGATDLSSRTLIVGWTPTSGSEAITATVAPDEGGLWDLVETIAVTCSAARWDGNLEFASKRADVDAMLTTLRSELSDDPKLGGFALDAYLAPTVRWHTAVYPSTQDSPAHANVEVDFTITVQVHAE